MPPKRTHSTKNQKQSSRDENEGVDVIFRRTGHSNKNNTNLLGKRVSINKEMTGRKRTLQESRGKRTFATEIQNFLGNNNTNLTVEDRMGFLRSSNPGQASTRENVFDSDNWNAYSNLNDLYHHHDTVRNETTTGAQQGEILASVDGDVFGIIHGSDASVDNHDFESLTQQLDEL